MSKPQKPPDSLSAAGKHLWSGILKDWPISDAAYLAVLQAGLEARDRAERCRVRIDQDSETLTDRFGQLKPHPLLATERDARSQFIIAIKALGLDPREVE